MTSSQKTSDVRWFIILSDGTIALKHDNTLPGSLDIPSLETDFLRHFNLGEINGIAYFCAELNQDTCLTSMRSFSLRQGLSLVSDFEYGLAVKAYSLIQWDKNHQFCSRCSAPTQRPEKPFVRVCPHCNLHFFPRISPSIIVLIRKNDQLLMARSPHFLPGIYGLIAGFVDAGESLEEAVHREVEEEVGITIKNLCYFGSQPWPFPDSLMVAFTADYESGEISIDQEEIVEAGWYRFDKLPGRPSTSISISSALIDDFIRSCQSFYPPL
ncbi:MAG: NAD(+) diphosphatase [Tatlockia sp.]|jgi:NAD+ diphosphatase